MVCIDQVEVRALQTTKSQITNVAVCILVEYDYNIAMVLSMVCGYLYINLSFFRGTTVS